MDFDALMVSGDRIARQRLGRDVVYAPGAGHTVTVRGIFDQAYLRIDANGQPGVSTSGPAVFLTLADLPTDPAVDLGARLTIGGSAYVVHEVQPDGLGAAMLLLHLA